MSRTRREYSKNSGLLREAQEEIAALNKGIHLHGALSERDWEKHHRGMELIQQSQRLRKRLWLYRIRPLTESVWYVRQAERAWEVDGQVIFAIKGALWTNEVELDLPDDTPDFIRRSLAGGYNGYVFFPDKPVVEPGFNGILSYVPVHGGITLAVHDKDGSLYGFDTSHFDSHKYPIRDLEWIRFQCWLMLEGIRKAAELEPAYLAADGDNEKRAKIVEPIVNLAPEGEWWNMGIGINLLTGKL